jgi:hypothetical protein
MAVDFLIFLPVRNGGHYVREAIDSVLAQTFPDWKLIVLENASTDDTARTVAAYDDPRIEVVPADRPLEMYDNWHRGYEYLGGDVPGDTIVTFLGHDDVFRPSFLADIASLVEQFPDATIYQTHFDLIGTQGELIRACRPVAQREIWTDMLAMLCWNLRDSFGTGYAFRAKDYRAVGGIPDLPKLLFSDHLVFTRLARLGYKACHPNSAFAYRLRAGSTSYSMTPARFSAHAEALDIFVAALLSEFSEFAESDIGPPAIASLLARELFQFESLVIQRTFSPELKAKLAKLRERYVAVARGIPASQLVGPPFSPSRLVLALRRLNMTQSFLRANLLRK